ncbi:MAG: radical SAM family heme chaperone HemW [Clostridiales bacterium]|nr:radical SAM family heme chaperone HemW [Clostridiales bacterium]
MQGIYVHIPFCKRKCRYCDFVSFPENGREDFYFVALISEMRKYAPLMKDRVFDTVFIGGGTPTCLKPGRIKALVNELENCFSIRENAEITCEANPESATCEKLKELKEAGVTRLSIGLQSADEGVLKAIGRIHTKEDFLSAVEAAKSLGFTNVNADVMHGLPLQDTESYLETLRLVTGLGLTHISSYALILEEGTPLYEDVNAGRVALPDPDETADMEDAGIAFLAEAGYRRYEISNFAKPGFECLHNLNYWDNGEYLGLGLNSHSALRLKGDWTRFNNTEVYAEYVNELGEGKLPVRNTQRIERDEEMFETIMLGLRKTEGVSRKAFLERFGVDPAEQYAPAIAELELDGMIEVTEERLFLNRRGMDFQNEALLKFMDQ